MKKHIARVKAGAAQVVAEMPAKASAKFQAKAGMAIQQFFIFLSAALEVDLKMLADLASKERKSEVKRDQLIPKYEGYVEQLQTQKQSHDILGYFLVWLFDAGLIERGIEFGLWCISAGQGLPERFNSKVPYFVASQIMDFAEAEFEAGRTAEPYFTQIFGLVSAEGNPWELPDKLMARFYCMKGLQAEKDGKLQDAFDALHRAFELGGRVKTAFKRVEEALAKAAAAQ